MEEKFTNLARREIADEDKIQRIIDFIQNIHMADDIGELFALIG